MSKIVSPESLQRFDAARPKGIRGVWVSALRLFCVLTACGTSVAYAAPLAAPAVKKSFDKTLINIHETTRMTIDLSNSNTNAITGVHLTDQYPVNLANSSGNPTVENTCGGHVTASSGDVQATLDNGSIPAKGNCRVVIELVGVQADLYNIVTNHTGLVTSANAYAGQDASASLWVSALYAPAVAMSFDSNSVSIGGIVQMTISLSNQGGAGDITGVELNDIYPQEMANAPANVIAKNTCGGPGSLTALPGGTSAVLHNGAIHDFCEIVLNVTGTAQPANQLPITNHTGPVTSDNAMPGADATADLSISDVPLVAAPIAKLRLLPDTILVDGQSILEVALANPNATRDIAAVQFTVNYPGSISNPASGEVVLNTCSKDPAHVSNVDMSNPTSLSISNAYIPAADGCVIWVAVTGRFIGDGQLQTSPILSADAVVGDEATAVVHVVDGSLLPAPTIQKSFVPTTVKINGTSQMTISFINNDPDHDLTGLRMDDVYPVGQLTHPANGELVRNTCGGLLVFRSEKVPKDVGLINGTIPAGGGCAVVVNVVGAAFSSPHNCAGIRSAANAAVDEQSACADMNITTGALLDAPHASLSFSPSNPAVGEIAQMTITLTNGNAFDIRGAQFNDLYPDGFENAPNPDDDPAGVVVSNTCTNGIVTADPNGHFAALAGGTIPGAGSCQVVINVVGTTAGVWSSTTGPIPTANALTGAAAISGLTVQGEAALTAPTVKKEFIPDVVSIDDPVQMKITLTNNEPTRVITGVQFTDPYPGGLFNRSSGVVESNTCGGAGTVTAPQNGTSISLINGTIAKGGSCEVVVNVVGKVSGDLLNQMQPVTSNNAIPSDSASATLHVTGGTPDLTLAKTHANDFWRDETGAVYTLTATNIGTAPTTTEDVTVTETPPAGMTATAMSGSGWICKMDTMTCTRSDPWPAGQSYPPITLTVDIDKNAPASLTNTATVSGGGESNTANDSASDDTQIALASPADLTLMKTHNGQFMQGQTGATYTLVVNNIGGTASNGQVTVVDTLPAGLTVTDMTGTGWMCVPATKTCTRGDSLAGATSFDPITLTVDVAANAPGTLTNTATVSGGGETNTANDTANDPTTIAPASSSADLVLTKTHVGSFTQGQNGATYTLTASNIGGAATSGMVTVTDTLPAGLTATAMAGTDWICTVAPTPTCTNSNVAASGTSYQPITLTVNVAADATTNIKNTATVSGGGETNTANDTVDDPTTITPAGGNGNHAPFATDDAIQVAPSSTTGALVGDAHQTNSVLDNDIDPDGGQLTADEPSQPSHGDLLSFNVDGTFSYRNNGDQATTDSFTYKACKGQLCDTATVTITIGVGLDNHAPIAVNDAAEVAPSAMTDVLIGDPIQPSSVLDNDHDADAGDTVKVGKVGPLLNASGTVAVSPEGLFTYTNGDSTATTDTLIYEACDDHGACTPATLTISIGDGLDDHLPTAANDAIEVASGDSTSALVGDAVTPNSVLHNDSDVDGDGLTAVKLSDPSHGSLNLAADGTFTYVNDGSPAMTDAFQYAACDSFGACEEATVAITIDGGGAPAADLVIAKTHAADFTQGQTGAKYTLTVSNVGSAATSGLVTVTDTLPVGLAAMAMSGGPSWNCSAATTTCTRSDVLVAGASYPAITLTVDVAADAPASVTNHATVSGGGETNTSNDAVGDPTTITAESSSADLTLTKTHVGDFSQGQTGATYTLIASNIGGAPTSGVVTVTDTLPAGLTATAMNGGPNWNCTLATTSCTCSDILAAGASYAPITLTVDVAVTAPSSLTNTATVSGGGETNTANDGVSDPTTIEADAADGHHVPFAVDDAIQVDKGGTTSVLVGDPRTPNSVLDNDLDLDSDALTAEPLTDPAHGTLLAFGADGTFTYQHSGDDATTDTFLYRACDALDCDIGIVTVTIGDPATHHLPIVVGDAMQVVPGGGTSFLIGDLLMPNSVLHNDSDPDGGLLTADKTSSLLNGSGALQFNGDGTLTYQNTDPSATMDKFLYEACDADGGCTGGTVTITITSDSNTDLPPIAMDDAIVVGPNGTATTLVGDPSVPNRLTDNDSDPEDGNALAASLIAPPSEGTAVVSADGTFSYTNTNPEATSDSFQYQVCDSFGACTSATVTITIDASAPTVTCTLPTQIDSVGDAVSFDLSLLFAAPPGKALDYSVASPPPALSLIGSLLSGTFNTSGTYTSTLKATTVPGGMSASEDVKFIVLPAGDILLRNGFDLDDPNQPVCH